MKCINCGTDNKLKDRTANNGRCMQCNHPFVFEPTTMGNVKITDPMFAKTIADISANNTLFFTKKQLLYFLDSRLRRKSFTLGGLGCLYLFFAVWTSLFFGGILSGVLGKNSVFIVLCIYQVIWVIYLYESTKSPRLNSTGRRIGARTLQVLGLIIMLGGMFISLSILKSWIAFVIAVIVGLVSIYLGTRQLKYIGIAQEFLFTQSQFQDWLILWQRANGSLLKIQPAAREENTRVTVNPDVTAYSFDRLVVCDRSAIAQQLIANNFHFENNCAILSVTGYPQSIFDTTMEMLRRNPELKVYAIHDCSPKGISLVHQLRTSVKWFFNSNVTIIDIGILPRQVIVTKRGMFIQSSPDSAQAAKELSSEIRQTLTAEELAWLDSGKFVELESLTPQRLIQVLQRGISGSQNLAIDDSSLILVGDTGNNDIYLVESFG
jgi:hypothetical protein